MQTDRKPPTNLTLAYAAYRQDVAAAPACRGKDAPDAGTVRLRRGTRIGVFTCCGLRQYVYMSLCAAAGLQRRRSAVLMNPSPHRNSETVQSCTDAFLWYHLACGQYKNAETTQPGHFCHLDDCTSCLHSGPSPQARPSISDGNAVTSTVALCLRRLPAPGPGAGPQTHRPRCGAAVRLGRGRRRPGLPPRPGRRRGAGLRVRGAAGGHRRRDGGGRRARRLGPRHRRALFPMLTLPEPQGSPYQS